MTKTFTKGRPGKGKTQKKGDNKKDANVQSATSLGLKADSLGIVKRRAKTHKGRKILESKEPKLIEDPKKSIIIKGNKTS